MMDFMKKTHCPKGHPYNGLNLYTDAKGRRHCRACMRERTRAWYHETDSLRQKARRQKARETYQPPATSPPSYDASFGHWLSGFVDGEGCFLATISRKSLRVGLLIQLRADDRPILEAIRDTLSVGFIYDKVPAPSCRLRASPTCQLMVRSVTSLYGVIIPQFDTYPLRSKKARDYAVWREIVMLAAAQKRGDGPIGDKLGDQLVSLIAELRSSRRYRTAVSS